MASWKKSFLGKPTYIYPADPAVITSQPKEKEKGLELDEADVWNDSNNHNHKQQLLPGTPWETKKSVPSSRSTLKKLSKRANPMATSSTSSLPVNVPDWSKILKEEYKEHRKDYTDEEDVDNDEDNHGDPISEGMRIIPPHEYLAMTRGASLSVHEGIGRTLKGRDLRRVRNAIWKEVGFED